MKKGVLPQGVPLFAMERVHSDDGAGNEIRTRYLHLGKVALCQMSYARAY